MDRVNKSEISSRITAGRIYKGQLNGLAGEETKLVFEDFANLGMAKVSFF